MKENWSTIFGEGYRPPCVFCFARAFTPKTKHGQPLNGKDRKSPTSDAETKVRGWAMALTSNIKCVKNFNASVSILKKMQLCLEKRDVYRLQSYISDLIGDRKEKEAKRHPRRSGQKMPWDNNGDVVPVEYISFDVKMSLEQMGFVGKAGEVLEEEMESVALYQVARFQDRGTEVFFESKAAKDVKMYKSFVNDFRTKTRLGKCW